MIPRSGYRADDMLDDVVVAMPGKNPSAEARTAAIVHAYELDDEDDAELWAPSAPAHAQAAAGTVSVQNPSAEGFACR